MFNKLGRKHCSRDCASYAEIFWIKNILLPKIDKYIPQLECRGYLGCDNHNTNKDTQELKDKTDYFFYFELKLPNGAMCYVHLGHLEKGPNKGKMYLYSITKDLPKGYKTKNMETILTLTPEAHQPLSES